MGVGLPPMVRVRVLGELALELDGTELELPASRRARSLLGLLAVERRGHPPSPLAARFLPDVPRPSGPTCSTRAHGQACAAPCRRCARRSARRPTAAWWPTATPSRWRAAT